MRALSSVGIGLSLISGCLFLALVAEVYYLLWWKKRRTVIDAEDNYVSPAKEFVDFFCWKKLPFLSSAAVNPQAISAASNGAIRADDLQPNNSNKDVFLSQPFGDHQDTAEAELMRLHSLAGPPRLLFTIKEETKEEMECESGRSKKGTRGKSLSDLFLSPDSPFLTPISSPPLPPRPLAAPLDCVRQNGLNPLFECSRDEDVSRAWASPPPKLKFLRDAEEKLYRKILMDEALKVQKNGAKPVQELTKKEAPCPATCAEQGDGSFITIVIGKGRERGHQHHPISSQIQRSNREISRDVWTRSVGSEGFLLLVGIGVGRSSMSRRIWRIFRGPSFLGPRGTWSRRSTPRKAEDVKGQSRTCHSPSGTRTALADTSRARPGLAGCRIELQDGL